MMREGHRLSPASPLLGIEPITQIRVLTGNQTVIWVDDQLLSHTGGAAEAVLRETFIEINALRKMISNYIILYLKELEKGTTMPKKVNRCSKDQSRNK